MLLLLLLLLHMGRSRLRKLSLMIVDLICLRIIKNFFTVIPLQKMIAASSSAATRKIKDEIILIKKKKCSTLRLKYLHFIFFLI